MDATKATKAEEYVVSKAPVENFEKLLKSMVFAIHLHAEFFQRGKPFPHECQSFKSMLVMHAESSMEISSSHQHNLWYGITEKVWKSVQFFSSSQKKKRYHYLLLIGTGCEFLDMEEEKKSLHV